MKKRQIIRIFALLLALSLTALLPVPAFAVTQAEIDELRGPKHDIGFGNQIRSYVLYPYKMVKDLRTGIETGNVDAVLKDGDLDPFVIGYHRWRVGGGDE